MPRESPYVIKLSKAERRELERRVRKYTLPYFQVMRAQIVLLAADGWRNDEIAEYVHTSRDVVSLWRKRFLKNDSPDWRSAPDPAAPGFFPPDVIVQIKALACELPSRCGVPLSRWSAEELAAEVIGSGLVASISGSTVWRWLNEDAIRPWCRRSWIFPRDPAFETKAGRVLDVYHGVWEAEPLGANDFVLSADEKTSIQARRRRHPTTPPRPHQLSRVEHEFERLGAWA